MSSIRNTMTAIGVADRPIAFGRHAGTMLGDLSANYLRWLADKRPAIRDSRLATDARRILEAIEAAHAVLAGADKPPRRHTVYVVERLGDISGATLHDTLTAALEALAREYPADPENGARATPDPEDDRILVWEVLPTGHKKVVWHFSGWHWDAEEFGNLGQGALPGDTTPLYSIALVAG